MTKPVSNRSFAPAAIRAAALSVALAFAGAALIATGYRITHPKGVQ